MCVCKTMCVCTEVPPSRLECMSCARKRDVSDVIACPADLARLDKSAMGEKSGFFSLFFYSIIFYRYCSRACVRLCGREEASETSTQVPRPVHKCQHVFSAALSCRRREIDGHACPHIAPASHRRQMCRDCGLPGGIARFEKEVVKRERNSFQGDEKTKTTKQCSRVVPSHQGLTLP